MENGSYTYLWEFDVSLESQADFERHYAPAGTWAQLFSGSPDYIETLLLKDSEVPGRYLTVDRWRSKAAYVAFRKAFASQYAELDRECERLTISERCLGEFHEVAA